MLNRRKQLSVSPESLLSRKIQLSSFRHIGLEFECAAAFFTVASQRVNWKLCAAVNASKHQDLFPTYCILEEPFMLCHLPISSVLFKQSV
jgi:hypothetical protein